MSHHLSLRIPDGTYERLARMSEAQGAPLSSVINTALEEWLRMQEHPGIVFHAGPAGRRPALVRGPDVWELVGLFREMQQSGGDAVCRTAEYLSLTEHEVRIALRYYVTYTDEIDEWIRENDRWMREHEEAWLREQALLKV
jgi:predicted transcriptional regulator